MVKVFRIDARIVFWAFILMPFASAFSVNELKSISVTQKDSETVLTLEADSALSPNIFKLQDQGRIVIDLTDTKMGSDVKSELNVDQGVVKSISVNQFEHSTNTLTRVVVGVSGNVDYKTDSNGNSLNVVVSSISELFEEAPSDPLAEKMDDSQQFTADVSPIPDNLGQTDTISPLESSQSGSFSSQAPGATELVDIKTSTSGTGTTITLIGNGVIDNYDDFVLSNPRRVVIDLNGLKNRYLGPKTISLSTPEASRMRLGATDQRIRVVLDTKSTSAPSYTISKEGSSLILRLASTHSAKSTLDIQGGSVSSLETSSLNQFETPQSTSTRKMRKTVVVGLSFKQLKSDNKSRLVISTDSNVPKYTAREEGSNRFIIQLANSRLDNTTLQREINTKAFDTAISTIRPRVLPDFTEFVVDLAQQVPYTITQSGKDILVDVDIPVRSVKEDSAPIPLANIGGQQSPPASESNSPLTADETMLSSPRTVTAPKNYRYVKEEFMNDTLNDGTPLSRMASILTGAVDGKQFTGRRISLDFKDAEVRSVFRLIADISRFNIIISDDVTGRITIRLDDVPWDQAFAIILQARGLWFEKYGNIIRVASADKLKQERESAAAAAAAAKAAKPLDVLFKPVSFANAGTLQTQIQSMLSERGTVDIDSRTNTLIIKDVREHLEKAKRLVDILDTQTPQVTIESRIVEATSTFTRSFGITWGGNARFTSATGNPTGLFFPNSVNVSPFALNFPVEAGFINSTANISLGSINNIVDLDLALALGEQEGHSKLISAPKVTVLDNKSANISAGSQIPFLSQTSNAGSSVRFETAATTLSVTPHITNDGSILMNVTASRNEPNFALLVQGNPIIDQRTASTEVLVKSGNTTVIGGIYSTQSARSQSRFPVLHRIPLIGALFKNYDKQVKRTELLIFVTPRIVGDEREAIREVAE
ncbi:MAG: type IV pilus secretin PilQ [Bdellovibrionales bacterium]|nr:type IV pilus secretin PilQ [Bdellovibrionales bacterium]